MKSLQVGVLGAAAVLAACGDGVVDPVVTFVTVTPDSVIIAVSETATLSVNVADASGATLTGHTIVWTTNDSGVATVTTEGVVTAIGPGRALVQAIARGIRGTARIEVVPGPVSLVTVSPGDAVVDSGATRSFEYVAEDAFGNAVPDPVRWTVGNAAVASVDSVTGRATGVTPGATRIIATVGGVADSADLVVESLAFNAVSAGTDYTCATSNGRSVYCWGGNSFGVLGNGTTGGNQPVPTRVLGATELVGVTAGVNHTCALTRGDAGICWGRNSWGQIGDNTTSVRPSPSFVGGGLAFDALDVGARNTCGLDGSGSGYCWGNNDDGQLGSPIAGGDLGAPPPNPLPIAMQGSPSFVQFSIGANHGCGRPGAGAAHCWGDGEGGAVGDDTTAIRAAPCR